MHRQQTSRPVKSFSIGFDDPAYNEAEHAGAVARHLGTDHTELYVRPEDALAVIPSLPSIYDEPFAYASQVSTLLVSLWPLVATAFSAVDQASDVWPFVTSLVERFWG